MLRRSGILLSGALTATLLNGVAVADCGAPELAVAPSSAPPGRTVTVTGLLLRDGICYDTGGCLQRQPNKQRPSRGAILQVVSADGRVTSLGEFRPEGTTYNRVKKVRLPDALEPGVVTLQAVREDGSVLAETSLLVRP